MLRIPNSVDQEPTSRLRGTLVYIVDICGAHCRGAEMYCIVAISGAFINTRDGRNTLRSLYSLLLRTKLSLLCHPHLCPRTKVRRLISLCG